MLAADVQQGEATGVDGPDQEEAPPEGGGAEFGLQALGGPEQQDAGDGEADESAVEAPLAGGDVLFLDADEEHGEAEDVDADEEPQVDLGAEFGLEVEDGDEGI